MGDFLDSIGQPDTPRAGVRRVIPIPIARRSFLAGLILTSPPPIAAHAQDRPTGRDVTAPSPRLPRDDLLVYRGRGGEAVPVRTADDWLGRRAEILAGLQSVMG